MEKKILTIILLCFSLFAGCKSDNDNNVNLLFINNFSNTVQIVIWDKSYYDESNDAEPYKAIANIYLNQNDKTEINVQKNDYLLTFASDSLNNKIKSWDTFVNEDLIIEFDGNSIFVNNKNLYSY